MQSSRLSRLINRNVHASTGRTSMRLEPEIWDALGEICGREGIPLANLIRQVEGENGGRTSNVRVYALTYFREAATEEGHRLAGHGPLPAPAGEPVVEQSSSVGES